MAEQKAELSTPPPNPEETLKRTLLTQIKHILLKLENYVANRDMRPVLRISREIRKFKNVINPNHMKAVWDCFFPNESEGLNWSSFRDFNPSFKETLDIGKSKLAKLQRCPQVMIYIKLLFAIFRQRLGLQTGLRELIDNIVTINRHFLDGLLAVSYYFYSLQQQRAGRLESIREMLLEHFSKARVRNDEVCQATLLTLLLRNYFSTKEYEAAYQLIEKSQFPVNKSNSQYCRYLYYDGFLKAVRSNYHQAINFLNHAYRKAPESTAKGFKLQCRKASVVVELLLGQIPSRETFTVPQMRSMGPYYKLTQSVLRGNLQEFKKVLEENARFFIKDNLYLLVRRMSQVVIKVGLRKINCSYSQISLADAAVKLGVAGSEIQQIVAKAIHDKVVTGVIDSQTKTLAIPKQRQVYGTNQPESAFVRRIQYCLGVHQSAQRAIVHKPEEKLQEQRESEEEESEGLMLYEMDEDG